MLRDYNFRDALRREVDRVALPREDEWIPEISSERGPWPVLATIGAIMMAAVLVILIEARPTESPVAQQPAVVTPPSRPTTLPGGIGLVPLPIMYHNEQFNYNLVVPAWFHQTASTGSPSSPSLLGSVVFTARSEADEAQFSRGQLHPWDLIVEVYRRGDLSVEQWAANLGCGASGQTASRTCGSAPSVINGVHMLVVTYADPMPGKMYLVERGEQLLVLRYNLGDESNRPQDVTQLTLDQIITSLGLP